MRRNKYRAIRTNGFSSKLEAAVYQMLVLREMNNEIKDIKCQQTVVLQEGPKEVSIRWKIDFSFINKEDNKLTYVEAKGIRTNDYLLKLKLFKKQKIAPLEIWGGSHKRLTLMEKYNPE